MSQNDDDAKLLEGMGYKQEFSRHMGAFSSFAISFSTICILAGGITAFAVGLCSAGGAGIGIGWPVGGLFAVLVAVSMGQIASAYPTAGGLYHWGSILGGRAWGWTTAWFNMLGLIFVCAAVDAGAFELFRDLILGNLFHLDTAAWSSGSWRWLAGTGAILAIHAALNHFGSRLTTRLTDFSGYLILTVSLLLPVALLFWSPVALDFGRLVTFTNFSGDLGGGVWPQTQNVATGFVLGLLLVIYTITGFDASAHISEETVDAARNAPKGIWRAVVVSVVFGYIMVCTFVLTLPDVAAGAAKGSGVFAHLMESSRMPGGMRHALDIGIVAANFLCGLACLTSASRMMFAFARDGGLPFSDKLKKVSPKHRTPGAAIWVCVLAAFSCCLYGALTPGNQAFAVLAAGSAVLLYISYIMPIAAGFIAEGRTWTKKGPFQLGILSKPIAALAVLGGAILVWVGFQPPNQLVGGLVLGLLAALAVLWWTLERRRFKGPPMSADQTAKPAGVAAPVEIPAEV